MNFKIKKSKLADARRLGRAVSSRRSHFAFCILHFAFYNSPSHYNSRPRRRGFTLVELLVVITIIALLAAMALGALAKAREAGKLAATKATIAKIDHLVMKRYETYKTRRVPLNFNGFGGAGLLNWVAFYRMEAIRYYMLREMPQCWSDITSTTLFDIPNPLNPNPPYNVQLVNPPALSFTYMAKYNAKNPNNNHESAKCLYLWVTTATPESKALFRGEEIATDTDGWRYFVDGWGNPIGFQRWAPAASAWSDIQVADPVNHHDPFDPMLLQNGPNSFAAKNVSQYGYQNPAYQQYPLIFAGLLGTTTNSSGQVVDDYGISVTSLASSKETGTNIYEALDPYGAYYTTGGSIESNGGVPRVTNHHIEAK